MSKGLPTPEAPAQEVTRGVLAIPAFRKLWNSMVFSLQSQVSLSPASYLQSSLDHSPV
jgi:hypothetical protein